MVEVSWWSVSVQVIYFESILEPVDKKYKEKMNHLKIEQNGKRPYTEKINAHLPSEW